MGSCLSKKNTCCSPPLAFVNKNQETEPKTLVEQQKKVDGQIVRREIFVIKHRISHEDNIKKAAEVANSNGESASLRRGSSCTKEEVDTILIQCGKLSRSSSWKNGVSFIGSGESSDNTSRKLSNSKKSFDFDNENRCGGSRGGSRSPVRRSKSPITVPSCTSLASNDANGINVRPGKMVSVPATVSSSMVDKNGGGAELISTAAIQRIQVKRNVGVASPRARSRSPAKMNSKESNENTNIQQQPLYLSSSNSRKKEDSPFRRNPISEIDTHVDAESMPFYNQKLNAEKINNGKVVLQGTEEKVGISKATLDYGLTDVYDKIKELKQQQQQLAQETKALRRVSGDAAVDVVASGFESLVPGRIRSRSPRVSRDLDINLRVQSNPSQSYTELLLEDIQNFHQKSRNPSFSVPPCVTKACSIMEAVADFNACTSSNLSSAFSEDRRSNSTAEPFNKNTSASLGTNSQGKNRLELKNQYIESEVALSDDLMECPRIQNYATFKRVTGGGYMEEIESSKSNSFVGYQRRRFSPSSQEPNSADSTDSWAPPKSYSRLYMNPLAFQKCTVSDHVPDMDEGKSRVTANKRDYDKHQCGIVRNSGEPRRLHITPVNTAAVSIY